MVASFFSKSPLFSKNHGKKCKMAEDTLGTEFNENKIKYMLFLIGTFLLYFFLWIGMQGDPVYNNQAPKMMFFLLFGFIIGFVPFLVDMLINSNKDLPLDTIGYENNSPFPILNSFKAQIIGSVLLSLIFALKISISGEAFVKAPAFSLTIPFLSELGLSQKLVSGLISGVTAGIVESIIFFGFIMPTLYAFLKKQDLSDLVAIIIAITLASTIFTGYHFWRYGYVFVTLMSVFIFGILQGIFAYIFRSMTPLIMTHFTNNLLVNLFIASGYAIQIIL